jgi:glyoxylase-like metal-dependent hydrolase (beta-lactamase superfamily II)
MIPKDLQNTPEIAMADDIPFRKEMDFQYAVPRELFPGVVRIVANNPGPFTFKGTNTYIVGSGETLALIDPGPTDDAHFAAIMALIGSKRLGTVLITHTHRDHTDGLPRLLAATGAKCAGFGRIARDRGSRRTSPSGSEFVDQDFKPDIVLGDGARFDGDGFALTALHTPGHAPDHLCFALEGTGILFSGDHVMSWNTSVVAPPEGNMRDYMASLDKLVGRKDEVFLPGHGGQLSQPQKVVRAFIVHRRMREDAILDCIRRGQSTIPAIVETVYRGLDSRLLTAAGLSVAAHVEHLVERGLVLSDGPPTQPERLSAV